MLVKGGRVVSCSNIETRYNSAAQVQLHHGTGTCMWSEFGVCGPTLEHGIDISAWLQLVFENWIAIKYLYRGLIIPYSVR